MSVHQNSPDKSVLDSAALLRQRLGPLDRQQIVAWQQMSPVRRLEMAFQAYQFALDAVRLSERRNHPGLSEQELNGRIVRRMQGRQFVKEHPVRRRNDRSAHVRFG